MFVYQVSPFSVFGFMRLTDTDGHMTTTAVMISSISILPQTSLPSF